MHSAIFAALYATFFSNSELHVAAVRNGVIMLLHLLNLESSNASSAQSLSVRSVSTFSITRRLCVLRVHIGSND